MNSLNQKSAKINAGPLAAYNCWLFTSQNIANYFLDLDKQNPLSNNMVEQKFKELLPNYSNLLGQEGGQGEDVINAYLNIYGIYSNEIYVDNPQPNNEKYKKIMKKIAYFLLVKHFSCSDTPIMTNTGGHWLSIAGIDFETRQALVLDSTPVPKSLDSIATDIANAAHNINNNPNNLQNSIVIMFPQRVINQNDQNHSSALNWQHFKLSMLNITGM